MSELYVVMDDSPSQQLNVGHAEVGMAMRNVFLKDKANGYIHQNVLQWLSQADRELLRADLGVRDSSLLRGFTDAVRRWEGSGASRLNRFPLGFRETAAMLFLQEKGHKVEVMTLNREFADAWRQAKGTVVRDVAHIKLIQGKIDYNRARLLVLGPSGRSLNVASNGSVTPTSAKPALWAPEYQVASGRSRHRNPRSLVDHCQRRTSLLTVTLVERSTANR